MVALGCQSKSGQLLLRKTSLGSRSVRPGVVGVPGGWRRWSNKGVVVCYKRGTGLNPGVVRRTARIGCSGQSDVIVDVKGEAEASDAKHVGVKDESAEQKKKEEAKEEEPSPSATSNENTEGHVPEESKDGEGNGAHANEVKEGTKDEIKDEHKEEKAKDENTEEVNQEGQTSEASQDNEDPQDSRESEKRKFQEVKDSQESHESHEEQDQKQGQDSQDVQSSQETLPEPEKEAKEEAPAEQVAQSSGAKKHDEEARAKIHETAISAAKMTLESHDPSAVCKGKSHWLYFMLPETPVAGTEAMVYFNKSASDVLRQRPHVQMYAGLNEWELELNPSTKDLRPSPVSKDDGSDWWSTTITIPDQAYELNFIFSDGDGLYDNNFGQDFHSEVTGKFTREDWLEGAAARAAADFEARMEAERKAEEEAKRLKLEQLKQQDLETAKWRIGEIKGSFQEWRTDAVPSLDYGEQGGWMTRPASLIPGHKAKLFYNANAGPLAWVEYEEDQAPTIKYGHNNWRNPQEAVCTRSKVQPNSDDDWWEADIVVPADAVVINFVVQFFENFDNNDRKDHKIPVGTAKEPEESWLEGLVEVLRAEEESLRLKEESANAEKKAKREKIRNAAREKTMAVARRQIKHLIFTDPPVVRAGDTVEIYYSSNNSCLNGKDQIYITGGWNRWTHKKGFGPLEMTPPGEDGSHWQATVDVPLDAYKMDFVFSDVKDGDGTYDNRGGFDYHIPVEDGVASEPPLHVMHIAVEMAPIAKVGGLGDVVTALGRAVKEQGHLVEVILPRYEFFSSSPMLGDMVFETEFDWGGTRIYVTSQMVEDLRVFFIEPRNGFFNTQSVYGRYDDKMRFEFFCKAALEFLLQTARQPDILHCHDWSTADVARAYWEDYHIYGLWKPKVVFTIHNMNYGEAKIGEAARHSQRFTTVSPTYAFEVGGNPAIAPHVGKFMGIRNGIDMDLWDPETDQFLPMGFTAANVVEGKKAARDVLSGRLGFNGQQDAPLIGVVSRLTGQKGVPLIKHAAWRAQERGGIFILLGSAPDPKIQAEFNALANQMNGQNASFHFAYDEPLSHLVYAACDFIVVPSMFEPCGLTQMIAMRYGAVPIVRSTGGLRDTVFDVDYDKARAAWEMEGSSEWQKDNIDETNGFAFEGTDSDALDFAMNRAIDSFWNDRRWFHSLQKRVMLQDWSWNRPALDYIELYYATLKS